MGDGAIAAGFVSTAGHRPSFADVAAAEIDHVHRYLVHVVRDVALAEDLTSATFERALREWGRYDPRRGRPRPWLLEIARNQARDHFRASSRRDARERRAAEPEATDGGVGRSTGLPGYMSEAMSQLSHTEREIIALRVILDMDGAETSRILGISRSAVSTGLHRGLGRLRAVLGEDHRS